MILDQFGKPVHAHELWAYEWVYREFAASMKQYEVDSRARAAISALRESAGVSTSGVGQTISVRVPPQFLKSDEAHV